MPPIEAALGQEDKIATVGCTATALSQEAGAALGAQASEARLRDFISAGRFRGLRRATETAFNMILEARP